MKTKTILASLAAFFGGLAVCLAADPNMGTWKLNEAKSKLGAGATKNNTVIYEAAGENVKITVDGVTSDGKPVHHEWTGKYDGKDYPVTGDEALEDTRSYKKAAGGALEFASRKDGKVTVTGRVVVAADGKSRTVTSTVTDASGKKISSTSVYDKQ
jgi:hypothetical protein